ncbi:MAG TPA: hypothetical protein VJR24_09170 [Gemmatimonadaceae bacterium]|nr:hypothetical protein [Gemmatimonadaceae bacterium]
MRQPIRLCVAPLVAAAALAACTRSAPDAKTTDSTTAAAPAPAATSNVLTITATDYAFDAPAQVPAGFTTIRVQSNGKEPHQAALIRIEQGKTFADFAAAVKAMAKEPGPPPAWLVDDGGPNPPMPNGTAESIQYLAPGTYAIVCFVPSPDGTPHIAKGMMRELTVTPMSTAGAVAAPNADASITLADYSFTDAAPLGPGHHVIRVTNNGPQSHEVVLIRLEPGKTGAQFAQWVNGMKGPPPGALLGGVAAMAPGDTAYFPADLTPGNYAFVCFVPDSKDGKPHVMHGMVKDFEVKGT